MSNLHCPFQETFYTACMGIIVPAVEWSGSNFVTGYNFEDGNRSEELMAEKHDIVCNQIGKSIPGIETVYRVLNFPGDKDITG